MKPRLVKKEKEEPEAVADDKKLHVQRLPGMEIPPPVKLTRAQRAELELASVAYEKARDRRMSATQKETEARNNLSALLHARKITSFIYEDAGGEEKEAVILNEEKIKVRVRKDDPTADVVAEGDEEEAEAEEEGEE